MYGDIRCPTRILWGEDDPWIPIERGRALHERVPHASFLAVEGVGHLSQLEAPDLVLKLLLDFFGPETSASG